MAEEATKEFPEEETEQYDDIIDHPRYNPDGKYDQYGFYLLPGGDFFDADGFYYDKDGYDEKGGYLDEKGEYHEGNDVNEDPLVTEFEEGLKEEEPHFQPKGEYRKYHNGGENSDNRHGEYALFGGSEGKWIEGIEQLPADFNNWELKLHNINYQMSQEDLLYVLQQYQVNCSFKSFGNGAAYIQCYDRDSFCRAMYLGGMELEGRVLRVSFYPPKGSGIMMPNTRDRSYMQNPMQGMQGMPPNILYGPYAHPNMPYAMPIPMNVGDFPRPLDMPLQTNMQPVPNRAPPPTIGQTESKREEKKDTEKEKGTPEGIPIIENNKSRSADVKQVEIEMKEASPDVKVPQKALKKEEEKKSTVAGAGGWDLLDLKPMTTKKVAAKVTKVTTAKKVGTTIKVTSVSKNTKATNK